MQTSLSTQENACYFVFSERKNDLVNNGPSNRSIQDKLHVGAVSTHSIHVKILGHGDIQVKQLVAMVSTNNTWKALEIRRAR